MHTLNQVENEQKTRSILKSKNLEIKKHFKYLIKLTVNSAQRVVTGHMEAIQENMKQYDSIMESIEAKKLTAEEIGNDVDLPGVWDLNGAMKEMLSAPAGAMQDEVLENIKGVVRSCNVNPQVPQFRISTMRGRDRKRLELAYPRMFHVLEPPVSEQAQITSSVVCLLIVQSFEVDKRYNEVRGRMQANDLGPLMED